MSRFNQQTTVQEIAAAYPGTIEGRTFVITGGTNGLGFAFAKFVAQQGAGTVVITGRSEERLAKALEDIKFVSGTKTTVKTLLFNMESQEAIRRAAEQITSGALGIPKIDVLLNNAGIMGVPYKEIDGCESQFFCNHIAHFLFTNLILPHITSPGGRIVNATSGGYALSGVRFNDHHFRHGWLYNKWQGYGQSKTANILFAVGLSNKLKAKGIESFSVHPGIIVSTGLGDHLDLVAEGFRKPDGTWTGTTISTDQGIATYMYAAISHEVKGKGGAYLTESQIKPTEWPMTDEDADKLWELSNKILGTNFSGANI